MAQVGAPRAIGDEQIHGRPSRARRVAGLIIGLLVPLLMTGGAATLGYAFAVYPIWHHLDGVRKTETLGTLISAREARNVLKAYHQDSGLDAKAFDHVMWCPRTVMTPFVGYAPAPGRHHNGRFDSHQLRGARRLTTPKPPGITRIFLTGASTALSVGAPSDERTIGGYLQSLLDRRAAGRYEVFTFASAGWSSTHERIAIENRLSDLEPDLVLELTGTADCLYGQLGRNVLWGRALSDQYYWDLVNLARERSGFERMADVQDVSSERVPPETVATRLQKNVRLAAGALAMKNARLHVFLQPAIFTSQKALSLREARLPATPLGIYRAEPEYYRECARRIGDRLGTGGEPANAAFTNLRSVFDRSPQTEEIFLDNFHFGDRGNQAIAEAMLNAIL